MFTSYGLKLCAEYLRPTHASFKMTFNTHKLKHLQRAKVINTQLYTKCLQNIAANECKDVITINLESNLTDTLIKSLVQTTDDEEILIKDKQK